MCSQSLRIDALNDSQPDPKPEEAENPSTDKEAPKKKEGSGTSGHQDPPPPSVDSLAILGVNDAGSVSSDDEEFPAWHDPMMPIEERMDLAKGLDELSTVYASLGQTDCTSCGYEDCKSYAKAIHGDSEDDLTLCIPGGEETEEMLHQLRDPDPSDDPSEDGGEETGPE